MVRLGEAQLAAKSEAEALLKDCHALLSGEFTLASGRVSKYYFDSKQLTLDPEGAKFVAEKFFSKVVKENIGIVGGTPYSAIPIASHICLYSGLNGRPIPAFYTRKATKGHGLERLLEGKSPEGIAVVAVVDDVVTTGDSLLEAIDMAEQESDCKVSWALTLLDRDEGGREKVEARGIRFWSLFSVELSADGEVRFRLNEP